MNFKASAELSKEADPAYRRVSTAFRRYVEKALVESECLKDLGITVRYVPIIMPDALKARYPARSKLRTKEQLFDCSPQLAYDVFVNGSIDQQIDQYIGGLSEAVQYLPKLGATAEQASEFEGILQRAKRDIIRELS